MQQPWRPAGMRVVLDKSTSATHLTSSSYGFGLSVTQTCQFARSSRIAAACPATDRRCAGSPTTASASSRSATSPTPAGTTPSARRSIGWIETGGLVPREVQPSAALVEARDDVSKLVVRWDDALADKIAAENLFLDRSKDRRRKEIDDLRAKVGACTAPTSFDVVENALRGQWTMSCERGTLQVAITLAPTMPPGVQYLAIRPSPAQSQAAGRMRILLSHG